MSANVHPCTFADASFCTAKTSLLFYFPSIRGRLSVSLLQIDDADTRREHKLTAGVSLIR